tara:strand:- start:1101 stop:1265 length:165 start_codon:yes stop_codon:yes gene_type:complete
MTLVSKTALTVRKTNIGSRAAAVRCVEVRATARRTAHVKKRTLFVSVRHGSGGG